VIICLFDSTAIYLFLFFLIFCLLPLLVLWKISVHIQTVKVKTIDILLYNQIFYHCCTQLGYFLTQFLNYRLSFVGFLWSCKTCKYYHRLVRISDVTLKVFFIMWKLRFITYTKCCLEKSEESHIDSYRCDDTKHEVYHNYVHFLTVQMNKLFMCIA